MSSALATAKLPPLPAASVYPQRGERPDGIFERLAGALGMPAALGFPGSRLNRFRPIVAATRQEMAALRNLRDADLAGCLPDVLASLRSSGQEPAALARALAVVAATVERRRARRLADKHLLAAAALLGGCATRLDAGEDGGLVALLAAATAALSGIHVHVVAPGDRLAMLQAEAMDSVIHALGLDLGLVTRDTPADERRAAYACALTVGAARELARDHLRDRILLGKGTGSLRLKLERLSGQASRSERLAMRGLQFAVILDADDVLIDQAGTPVLLLEETRAEAEQRRAEAAHQLIAPLEQGADFQVITAEQKVALTDQGRQRLARQGARMGSIWNSRPRREEVAALALAARHLFKRDQDYMVEAGRVRITSDAAARASAKTIHSEGLQQLIEVAEGCRASAREVPVARISMQRFFGRYQHLCGVSSSLRGARQELWAAYRLPVVFPETESGSAPRRLIYADETRKNQAIIARAQALNGAGLPVVVAVQAAAAAAEIGGALSALGLEHEVVMAPDSVAAAESLAKTLDQGRIALAIDPIGQGFDFRATAESGSLTGVRIILDGLYPSRRLERRMASLTSEGDAAEVFLSLDDPLLAKLVSAPLRWLTLLPGALGRGWGRVAFARAQRSLERYHVRSRRELMKTDRRLVEILAFSGGMG